MDIEIGPIVHKLATAVQIMPYMKDLRFQLSVTAQW